jgi:hypothetical protein
MKVTFAISRYALLGAILFFGGAVAQAAPLLKGKLLERGTKKPIEGARVFLLPEKKSATTDSAGRFEFPEVPLTSEQLVINHSGYQKREEKITPAESSDSVERVFYLERLTYAESEAVYETTITDREARRDDSKRSLSAKQATSLPGSGNDAIRAIQNLPGVARVPGLSSRIVIQGSAPQDTVYTIDGHEVPIIFHFGGFSSVLQPEALDRVDYLSAGYGPNFGRAQGGLIGGWTKTPDADRLKGFAFMDLLNAGGAIETPLDEKSSLFFGLRKSYIGAVLKAATKNESDFAFTAAPSFDDASLIYQRKVTDRDDFKLVMVGSRDTLEFLLSKPVDGDPSLRGDFYNRTAFVRVIPQWVKRHENGSVSRASLGIGNDWVKFVLGSDYFNLRTQSISSRLEHERDLAPNLKWVIGTDNRFNSTDITLRLPEFYSSGDVANPISSGTMRELTLTNLKSNTWSLYTQGIYTGFTDYTLQPGLRFDYFEATNEAYLAPRFAARRKLSETLAIRSGTGLYYQPATRRESAAGAGNPDIESPRAYHLAVGVEKDFRDSSRNGFMLTSGPFYRQFKKLIVQSTSLVNRGGELVPERYNNSGSGESYGLELLLQGAIGATTLTTSYTLSRSVRRDPTIGRALSGFDQTHNLNLIAARELPRNWKVSSRFRYVTGNPLTPVNDSVFDADNGSYFPIRGSIYSTRTSPFWQLDVRFDKKWIYDSWILSAYLDLQNVTNRRNIENVQYSYDYREREDAKGLPILPILGLKGEF